MKRVLVSALVALPRAREELVRELLEDAWAERAPKALVREWCRGRGLDE